MKYTFLGDRCLFSKYEKVFPEVKDYLERFIECEPKVLLNFLIRLQINHECCVMAFEDCDIPEDCKLLGVKNIREFVCERITASDFMPKKARIEASTLCQLDCKECYMRLNNFGAVGKGYLKYIDFKNFIDAHPFIQEIELSNSGEIFLNPELVKILEYAHDKNVQLTAVNGVNFNHVTSDQLNALVNYKFKYLMVSIDGATEETYRKYRRNGSFKEVIKNIKTLLQLKEEYNSDFPKIVWQYIIMPETEKDVHLAKEKAAELGIPIWFKLTWDEEYIPQNPKQLSAETGLLSLNRLDYLRKNHKVYIGSETCSQMFISPQINWDGRLLGCCELFLSDYGANVFDVGLQSALKQKLFIESKKLLLNQEYDHSLDDRIPCLKCKKYIQRLQVGEALNPFSSVLSQIECT